MSEGAIQNLQWGISCNLAYHFCHFCIISSFKLIFVLPRFFHTRLAWHRKIGIGGNMRALCSYYVADQCFETGTWQIHMDEASWHCHPFTLSNFYGNF